MNNDISFFYCYNKNVSDHLRSEGIDFITVAQDLKTKKVFSLYIINDEFQKALDKYTKK